MPEESHQSKDDEIIACLLSERERAIRADEIARELIAAIESIVELDDGYAYRFPAGEPWADRVIEFVQAERRCCPFATYEVAFEPHRGPVWLRVRGSPAIKQFVREQLIPIGPENAVSR